MKLIYQLFALLTLLTLSVIFGACTGLRSANGLAKGELSVGYNSPAGGAIRYGITDNIEIRGYSIGDESLGGDLFLHTHDDERPVNVGLTLGSILDLSGSENILFQDALGDQKLAYYIGATIDYKLNDNIRPYFTYTYSTNLSPSFTNQATLGVEFRWFLTSRRKVGIIFAPEAVYFPESLKVLGSESFMWPSVHAGVTFDLSFMRD